MIILNSQVVKKSYNWKIHAPNWSISLLPIPQQINFSPDMTLHRTMNRTICESSFSENIMLNFPKMRKSTLPKMTQIAPNLKQGLFSCSFSRYFFHVFWKLEYFQIRNFNRSIISIFIISIISILILYQLLLFPKSRFS